MYASHANPRTHPVGSPHTWQPFTSHRQIWMDPTAPEKKGSRHNPQHASWPIYGSVPSFSPKPTNEAVDLSQASIDDKLLDLLGPKTLACDQYVQYLLTGTNPSVLNWHMRGLPHKNIEIATTLSLPFPSECSTDPPKWPCPVSSLTKFYQLNQCFEFKEPMTATWSPDHSALYCGLHLRLAIVNDLPPAIGSTRIG
jgi:hypothetical protein